VGQYDASRGYGGWTQDISSGAGAAPVESWGSIEEAAADIGPNKPLVMSNGRYIRDPSKLTTGPAKLLGKEWIAKAAGPAMGFLVPAAVVAMMSPSEEARAAEVQGLEANDPKRLAYEEWRTLQDKTSDNARQLYNTWYGAPTQTAQQLATNVGITLEQAQAQPQFAYNIQQPITAAHGGIVGLQEGGEIAGPGTGTSDSIPARLSDGEFVMTADAVRGMGNGSRDLGAARMYDLMSRFERTA
jgi:hypothetical protein